MRHTTIRLSVVALIGLLTVATLTADPKNAKVQAIYRLANIGLSGYLAEHLGLQNVNDHGIELGGIGSDLWHSPNDGQGIYWMITDRGPNGEDPRTFPVPEFTPFILKARTASDGSIEILQSIPVTGFGAAVDGVTGIANLINTVGPPALNEPIFGCGGAPVIPTNPHGLDTEGLVRTRDGNFWAVEEYGPSILKIDAHGKVVKRYLPEDLLGFMAPITGYSTDDSALSVPEIYGQRRRLNRGFEGIALSPNEQTLYLALQSPFLTPTGNAGRDSRNTRILAFDLASEQVTAEYVYQFQHHDEFNVANQPTPPFAANRARDMKLSALTMLDQHRMLALERTDFIAKQYLVDLRGATNILGTVYDDPSATTAQSLEAVADLAAAGIDALPKEFVITLDSTVAIDGMPIPQKIEGMTVVDGRTLVIANDNDFGVGSFTGAGVNCQLNDTGLKSQIIVLRLDQPLKK